MTTFAETKLFGGRVHIETNKQKHQQYLDDDLSDQPPKFTSKRDQTGVLVKAGWLHTHLHPEALHFNVLHYTALNFNKVHSTAAL